VDRSPDGYPLIVGDPLVAPVACQGDEAQLSE
jgi:hypothetical protein